MNIITKSKLQAQAYPYVGIDAEWYKPDRGVTAKYLTKQFTFYSKGLKPQLTIVLWDANRPMPTAKPEVGHEVYVIPCNVQTTVLKDVADLPPKLSLMMYYSPKDVEATIGTQVWRDLLLEKNSPISKKRNLTGTFKYEGMEYTLLDLVGAFNSPLDDAIKSVGLNNPYKDLVTRLGHDKGQMNLFMNEYPNEFLEYAVGDTIYLGELLNLRVQQANQIIKDALGSEVPAFTDEDFPRSSGSLVAKTFEKWLIAKYPGLMKAALLLTDSNDNKVWAQLRTVKKRLSGDNVDLEAANKTLRGSQFRHGLSMASIPTYALLSQNTGLFGAIVQGGRCVNEDPKENPFESRLDNVVDIDLSSCYGSALREFDYPIGIPTIFERWVDDKVATLGEFLKKNERELVDGLYQIVVSGMLSFRQDLVHSKYGLTTKKILKTLISENFEQETENVYGREIEPAHIGGDFVLTRKQIENGIITADNLKVIRGVASNAELKEWMSLEVVCAVYYPKSKELDNAEFAKVCSDAKSRGRKTMDGGDTRTRCWTRIPLEAFIGNFITYRQKVKRQVVRKGDEADLLQNSVKLFVNTTYGCLASPYFPMGNTVLANNITAKARTGVWMLSKALLTKQSITDGGIFDCQNVLYLKPGGKKPSFEKLATRETLTAYRYVRVAPLTDRDVWDWMKNRERSDEVAIDTLCTEHINAFWKHYGLKLAFNIEVKYGNTARSAVYFYAADYLLVDTVDADKKGNAYAIRVRGAREENHPKKMFLWHLYDPETTELPSPRFEHTELIGVSDFQKNPHETLMPGDEIEVVTTHKPYPQESYDTYVDYKRHKDSQSKAIARYAKEESPGFFGLAKAIAEGAYRA